ncbi:TPA: DUF551 domain-containing protein [Klebsiella variicola subsp. variicola]|nr:DUF551 domain-containing protein [Klebsiella variicola subsp. variicola]
MTSKLTRERLEKIKSWRETYGAGSNVMLPAEEAEELACLALAAMDSEPVIPDEMTPEQAYEIGDYHGDPVDVFARGANWMRQHIIDSTLAAAPQLPGSEPATVPGKWIPVSERLPEAGGDMIVFTDGIVMSGVSYAKKKGFYIQALEYDDDEPVDSVTHWMSLPSAPQEVKGE